MKSHRQRMSIQEYHRLPYEPGWKIEYWDGMARWTPRTAPVKTVLAVQSREPVACTAELRAVAAGHAELVTGYALGNLASEAFCRRLGFVDAPSETVAQKRWRYCQQELARHAPGELAEEETALLTRERDHWRALVDDWEARSLEERFADRDE